MKTLLRFMLIAGLAALPLTAVADDDESTVVKAEVGVRGVSEDDLPDKAAEYESIEDGPVGKFLLKTDGDWGSLLLYADYVAKDDNRGKLDFDVKRMVRSHTSYDLFPHRLGHDPMENLEATSINGKVVRHTDLDPNQEYGIEYSVIDHRTELQFPALKALTLAVEYRDQKREGHVQAYSTSHCDNCHTTSQAHGMDEKTTDGTLEARVDWRGGFVRGRMTSRELTQGSPSVPYNFDNALHPELQAPVFDNRLQFDDDINPTIADFWPNIDKDVGRLDLHLNNLGGFVWNAGGVWSETENKYTGLKSEYTGYVINAARLLGKSWRLRWRGRVYSIDNDDYFIDTIERVGVAGPHAGLTYEDVYGRNFDYLRQSALNRDVFESKLDLSFRVGRRAGNLRFLWDYETIDREHYQVAVGETETTTNLLGVTYRYRPIKGLRLDAELKYAAIDNPFMLIDGTCSTLVSDRYTNPWQPETPQYHDFQDARIADTTASPSEWGQLRLGASYVTGSSTLSGTYRYWDGSNDDGDLTDWSRSNQTATITFWSMPEERWDWYVALAWQDSELESPACIPIFDG
jgi:hypothetical protein